MKKIKILLSFQGSHSTEQHLGHTYRKEFPKACMKKSVKLIWAQEASSKDHL